MTRVSYVLSTVTSLLLLTACNNASTDQNNKPPESLSSNIEPMIPDKKLFEDSIDGKKTTLYVLKNHNGMTAAITNYGGRIVSLLVPDREGKMTDVVVGFKSVKDYQQSTEPYFGATVGRFGNRIASDK